VNRERKVLLTGKDHTDMLPIFRFLVEKTGAKKGDALIWAGCEGACYAMATFFSYFLNDLGLNLYFATDADSNRLWRLELRKEVGMVATKKEPPIKAKVIVLMSGLVHVPFDNVLALIHSGLADGGVIIGETVVPGLFESLKWHEQIPLRFLFEFSMERPTALELEEGNREKEDEN
jgi:hypothetical protein